MEYRILDTLYTRCKLSHGFRILTGFMYNISLEIGNITFHHSESSNQMCAHLFKCCLAVEKLVT